MFEIEKKLLFAPKNLIFESQKSRIFPKGLTQVFSQKVVFGENKSRNNV